MILHLIFIFLYAALGSSFSPEAILYASIAQCCIAAFLEVRKDANFISPYNVHLLALVIINLGNISLISRIATGTNIMYYFASAEDIPEAAEMWCISNSIFLLGYKCAGKLAFPSLALAYDRRTLTKIFSIILVLSVLPKSLVELFFPGTLSKVLNLGGLIGVLFFARLWTSENDKQYRKFTLMLFAIQMYAGLFLSYLRFQLVMPVVILFAGYFSGLRSLSALFSYRILPFVFVIILFFNSFGNLGANRANFGAALAKEYMISDEDEAEEEENENNSVYDQKVDRGGLLDRSATLAQLSQTILIAKKEGHYDGAVSAPLLTALIPRFLWPNKPKIAIGQWFAIKVGAAYVADNNSVNNSVNITIPGEFYLDFGWVGVIVGCFLFGFLFAMLWNCAEFNVSFYNFNGAIFGGYLLTVSLFGLAGDLQIVVNYISFYLIFYVVKKILCAYFV